MGTIDNNTVDCSHRRYYMIYYPWNETKRKGVSHEAEICAARKTIQTETKGTARNTAQGLGKFKPGHKESRKRQNLQPQKIQTLLV
jgi:hypothetical protein